MPEGEGTRVRHTKEGTAPLKKLKRETAEPDKRKIRKTNVGGGEAKSHSAHSGKKEIVQQRQRSRAGIRREKKRGKNEATRAAKSWRLKEYR